MPLALLLLLAACHDKPQDTAPVVEPLDLPDDPSVSGVPAGVRTVEANDLTMEIWYPAPDAVAGQGTVSVDFRDYVPDSVKAVLGDFELPLIVTGAVRDAPLRLSEEPYPIVLFSHGFAGCREQSVDYAVHLASRGYVVVAVDHPGRMMADILPCMFSPPLEGCDISFEDPAEEQLPDALDWVLEATKSDFLAGYADSSAVGLSGHSAGGNSAASVGNGDERFEALLTMAANLPISRNVPNLQMAGTCDGVVGLDETGAAVSESVTGDLLQISRGGHLDFSDLCTLDLGAFAAEYLVDRKDISATFLDLLLQLGKDGCPQYAPPKEVKACAGTSYLDIETGQAIVRAYSTSFFDATLRGAATWPPAGGSWPDAVLQTRK